MRMCLAVSVFLCVCVPGIVSFECEYMFVYTCMCVFLSLFVCMGLCVGVFACMCVRFHKNVNVYVGMSLRVFFMYVAFFLFVYLCVYECFLCVYVCIMCVLFYCCVFVFVAVYVHVFMGVCVCLCVFFLFVC